MISAQVDNSTVELTEFSRAAAHDTIVAAKREKQFEIILREKVQSLLEGAQANLKHERQLVQQLRTQLAGAQGKADKVPALEAQLSDQVQQIGSLRKTNVEFENRLKTCQGELSRKALRLKALQVCTNHHWKICNGS